MLYLDTSVLVPLFQEDLHSPRTLAWMETVPAFVLSSWTVAEFSSALAVRSRMRQLSDPDRWHLETQLDQWLTARRVLNVLDQDVVEARQLVRRDIRLRAPDALHIAIARRGECELATLDQDMAAAATRLGLPVITP